MMRTCPKTPPVHALGNGSRPCAPYSTCAHERQPYHAGSRAWPKLPSRGQQPCSPLLLPLTSPALPASLHPLPFHTLSLSPPPALPLPPSQVLTCWGSSGRPQAPGPAPATIQGCPPRPAALPALLPAAVLKSPPVQQRQLCSACGQPLPCLAPCWQQLWRQCCCLYCCLLGSGYVWLHGGWT